jgi:hypothetical protein
MYPFAIFYNKGISATSWSQVGSDGLISLAKVGGTCSLDISLVFPEDVVLEDVQSFNGTCLIESKGAISRTIHLEYNKPNEDPAIPTYELTREDNPCLFDGLIKILSKNYGYHANPTGLTRDELDMIQSIPAKFMAGVKQTSAQTTTDIPVEFTSLEELSLLRYLDVVGKSAFEQCTNLVNVKITSNADIGSRAFAGCTSLTTVNIKAKRIASDAFVNCPNLQEIHISTNGIPEIAPSGSSTQADVTNMFGGAEINIYVPESLEDVYNSSPWGSIPNVTIIGEE